jgi:hypothetical protein
MRIARAAAMALALTAALGACAHSGRAKKAAAEPSSRIATIGINAYLWRASLETLSFMPMAQVDSNGGVMITEWYANPQAPGERVKVTVAILDKDLRADALRVSAVREQMTNNQWVEAPVRAGTVQKLEETILTRARDIRNASLVK